MRSLGFVNMVRAIRSEYCENCWLNCVNQDLSGKEEEDIMLIPMRWRMLISSLEILPRGEYCARWSMVMVGMDPPRKWTNFSED